jgi:hypothetical protein
MKRVLALAVLASLFVIHPIGSASADADKTGKVEIGKPYTWDGTRKLGVNPYYFKQHSAQPDSIGPFSTYTCSSQPYQTCETVLLEFSNPLTPAEIAAGKTTKTKSATIYVDTFDPAQVDFDFVAWASDAQGTKGEFFTGDASGSTSGHNPGQAESKTFSIETTIDQPSVWMLLEVVYFAAPNATYKGRATF